MAGLRGYCASTDCVRERDTRLIGEVGTDYTILPGLVGLVFIVKDNEKPLKD